MVHLFLDDFAGTEPYVDIYRRYRESTNAGGGWGDTNTTWNEQPGWPQEGYIHTWNLNQNAKYDFRPKKQCASVDGTNTKNGPAMDMATVQTLGCWIPDNVVMAVSSGSTAQDWNITVTWDVNTYNLDNIALNNIGDMNPLFPTANTYFEIKQHTPFTGGPWTNETFFTPITFTGGHGDTISITGVPSIIGSINAFWSDYVEINLKCSAQNDNVNGVMNVSTWTQPVNETTSGPL